MQEFIDFFTANGFEVRSNENSFTASKGNVLEMCMYVLYRDKAISAYVELQGLNRNIIDGMYFSNINELKFIIGRNLYLKGTKNHFFQGLNQEPISQDKINAHLLSEINERIINFPDFKEMGKFSMAQFIWNNCPDIEKHSPLKNSNELAHERSELELEIWCKETYTILQDSLNQCVTANSSSTISINAAVE